MIVQNQLLVHVLVYHECMLQKLYMYVGIVYKMTQPCII